MARNTQLPETINDYNFVRLARQERHACTRERLLGMAHLQTHSSLTRTGRSHKLTDKQLSQLEDFMRELESQRSGSRIKGKEIQAEILNQFGVEYHLSSLYYLLHRQGLSWITVRSKHPNGDPIVQEALKKTLQHKRSMRCRTARLPVLFDPSTAKSLLRCLLKAISGKRIYEKTSFLAQALGRHFVWQILKRLCHGSGNKIRIGQPCHIPE